MRVLPIPLLELKILQVGEFAPRKRGNAAQKLNNLHFYAHAEKFGGEMNSQGDHKYAFYDEQRNVARIQAFNFTVRNSDAISSERRHSRSTCSRVCLARSDIII